MSRPTHKEARWASIRSLIAAGVRGSECLPSSAKADVYEGIALISHGYDAATEEHARRLAESLRDAEGLQLHFKNLFANA